MTEEELLKAEAERYDKLDVVASMIENLVTINETGAGALFLSVSLTPQEWKLILGFLPYRRGRP